MNQIKKDCTDADVAASEIGECKGISIVDERVSVLRKQLMRG